MNDMTLQQMQQALQARRVEQATPLIEDAALEADKDTAAITAAVEVGPVAEACAKERSETLSHAESKSTPNVDEAIAFLRKRPWPPCLTAIWVKPDGSEGMVETQSFESADDPKLRPWIQNHLLGANLYHHTNPTRGPLTSKASKADIIRLASLHCEIDPKEGESPDQCKARVLAMIDGMDVKPTLVVQSGNGMQLIWDLNAADQIALDGTEAVADDLALFNVALIQKYDGDKSAKDVTRILRLPGTWNIPNKSKLKKGRTKTLARFIGGTGLSYSLGDFDKAQPANAGKERTASDFKFAGDYQPILFDDPALKVLDAETFALGRDGDVDGKYHQPGKHKRSGAAFAFAIKTLTAKLPPEKLAAIFVDSAWAISAPFLEKTGTARAREVERTIARAIAKVAENTDRATDAVIAKFDELNVDNFVIGNIGGKCRIGTFIQRYGREQLSLSSVSDFALRHPRPFLKCEWASRPRPFGEVWAKSEHRLFYDGVTFEPLGPAVTADNKLNLWRGFGVEPHEGDWHLMRRHIFEVLAAGDKEGAEYITNWIGWGFQNPGTPAGVALVFRGGQGIGKGVTARAVKTCYGQHGFQTTKIEQILGRFNAPLQDCCLLYLNEAHVPRDSDRLGTFKGYITEPTIAIERKGVDIDDEWPNCLHVIIDGNGDQIAPVESDDRRSSVFEVSEHRKNDVAYFNALYAELSNGGLAAMLHDLQKIDLGHWRPFPAFRNAAHTRQKALGLRPAEVLMERLLQDQCLPGSNKKRPNFSRSHNPATERGLLDHKFKLGVDRRLIDVSDKKITLVFARFGGTACQDREGSHRGWEFESPADCRARWEAIFGKWEWETEPAKQWRAEDVVPF